MIISVSNSVTDSEIPQQKWNLLLSRTSGMRCQNSYEAISSWEQHMATDWTPLVLRVSKGNDDMVALVPLMYRDEKRRRIAPYRRVRFLAYEMLDFSQFLCANDDLPEVARAVIDWLYDGPFDWQSLIFDDLIADAALTEHIKKGLDRHAASYEEQWGRYYFIPLNRHWEQILADTHKKFVRRNMREAMNKLNRCESWEIMKRPDWDVAKIIDTASEIHQRRQSQLQRDSLYSVEGGLVYASRFLGFARQQRSLSTYWLSIDNSIVAYMIGIEEEETFFFWNTGFNPDFAHFSPSRVLLYEAVRNCHERGLQEFNFMRGESDYKPRWTPHYRGNVCFRVFNRRGLYNRLLHGVELSKLRKLTTRV